MPPASLSAIIVIMPGPKAARKSNARRRSRTIRWILLLIQYTSPVMVIQGLARRKPKNPSSERGQANRFLVATRPLSYVQRIALPRPGVLLKRDTACGEGYYRHRNHRLAGPANHIDA